MFTATDKFVLDQNAVARNLVSRFQPKDRPSVPGREAVARAILSISANSRSIGSAVEK